MRRERADDLADEGDGGARTVLERERQEPEVVVAILDHEHVARVARQRDGSQPLGEDQQRPDIYVGLAEAAVLVASGEPYEYRPEDRRPRPGVHEGPVLEIQQC